MSGSCEKVRFQSESHAWARLVEITCQPLKPGARGLKPVRVHWCHECQLFHLTTERKAPLWPAERARRGLS
jgi:hypothetical protein